jgi:hypothetical protein
MSQKQYSPEAFLAALESDPAEQHKPVLVGGQAVNFWAEFYAPKLPEIQQLQPFLSKDCDIYGNRDIAQRMQKQSGWRLSLFGPRRIAVAALVAEDGRTIEVLSNVRGLTPKDLDRMCMQVQMYECSLCVLNPIALLKAKLANVAELDQTDRQDSKHVSLLIPIVREFISQTLTRAGEGTEVERDVILLAEAALHLALSKHAKLWQKAMGKEFEQLIPRAQLKRSQLPKVRNFVAKRLPQILREVPAK